MISMFLAARSLSAQVPGPSARGRHRPVLGAMEGATLNSNTNFHYCRKPRGGGGDLPDITHESRCAAMTINLRILPIVGIWWITNIRDGLVT